MSQSFSDFESSQQQLRIDVLHNQLDRDLVVTPSWNNDIGMGHGRQNIIGIRWLHHGRVLFKDTLEVTAAL